MKEKEYQFETEFLVRDYEVDLQGVVNNANYMHYLEHARHLFLLSKGVDFAAMHDEGKDLIVTRAELKYRSPLKSKDRFIIKQYVLKEGHVQIAFIQDIFRPPDNNPCLSAKITGVCLNGGKPVVPDEVLRALNL